MIGQNINPQDYKNRKDYLLALAAEYAEETSQYIGMPEIYYDGTECDGSCLADDIRTELEIS